MKKGEAEACQILKENIHLTFDEFHHDDGAGIRKPDLLTKDGLFIEVTHTNHSHATFAREPEFACHLSYSAQVEIAINRHYKYAYSRDESGCLTPEGEKQYLDDMKLLKDILHNSPESQKICDEPSSFYSIQNILYAICENKGRKYKNFKLPLGLFVFVTKDEMSLLLQELGAAGNKFEQQIPWSIFKVVYLCEWDFRTLTYNVKNPLLIQITADSVEFYNCE